MNPNTRRIYVEYIAGLMRFAQKETGCKWPDDAILITSRPYSKLAELDELLGMKIYISWTPITPDPIIVFPANNEKALELSEMSFKYMSKYSPFF